MLRLRSQFDVFTSGTETLSVNGEIKTVQLKLNDHNITLVGNFGLSLQAVTLNFQHTGTWYEFFSGEELNVTDVSTSILLSAGDYRLYSDKKLPAFKDLKTNLPIEKKQPEFSIYPNPATDMISVESKEIIKAIELFSIDGKLVQNIKPNSNFLNIRLGNLNSGIYFLRVETSNQLVTEKIVKK
jgi:hypothetical protein